MGAPSRHAPTNLTVDRDAGMLQIRWVDGHATSLPLGWLRAHCPCASCREVRRQAAGTGDELTLNSGPLPSSQIANAELVGGYAIRLVWTDGHDTGIYPFAGLRAACSCPACSPDGIPMAWLD